MSWFRSFRVPRIGAFKWNTVACAEPDTVALAIKLCAAGVGHYWDGVDLCLRNEFAELQLTRGDSLEQDAGTGFQIRVRRPQVTDEPLVERSLAPFVGTVAHLANLERFLRAMGRLIQIICVTGDLGSQEHLLIAPARLPSFLRSDHSTDPRLN